MGEGGCDFWGGVSQVMQCGCVEDAVPVSLGVLRMESVADMTGKLGVVASMR